MKIALLSGGSGKRLWPLSNEVRSKIFLKLLDAPNGDKESMIQRVYRQLDSAELLDHAYIVTHESQTEAIRIDVGDRIPLIAERHKRGTFTAVALAAAYFHSMLRADPDEVIVFMPVDLFVEGDFFARIRQMPEVLAQSKADLALIGSLPTHPSGQYGYILPKEPLAGTTYHAVGRFIEKPDRNMARRLILKGALWNCGVFAMSLRFMLSVLAKRELPSAYEELVDRYADLPELSFDQEVVEKKSVHSVVLPFSGKWKDIGSWDSLTEYLSAPVIGPGEITDKSVNTHLINNLTYPIYVVDVPHIVVAASADGILVASKQNSGKIKQMIQGRSLRPMFEERRWGTYRVLDHGITPQGLKTLTKRIELFPGKNISYQLHRKRQEVWTILSGTGELLIEGKLSRIVAGDVVQIPLGTRHGVKAITPLAFIEVQIGTELVEEDIERLAMNWRDALRMCGTDDLYDFPPK